VTWWFVLRHHQDLTKDGSLVIGGDVDSNFQKLTTARRRGSSRGTGSSTLLVNLLPQPAAAEGVSCTLVIGARYVQWITVYVELGLKVAT
jgi:hypothetical protein